MSTELDSASTSVLSPLSTVSSRVRSLDVPTLRYLGGGDGTFTDPADKTRLLDAVRREGLAVLRGFPADGGALVTFGRQFGELEPADPFAPDPSFDDPMDWLGHTNVAHKKTWGSALALHTAAAHAPVEPQLQIMLMLDQGLEQVDPDADNGQSVLARVDDAVAQLEAELGGPAAAQALELLKSAPVSTEFPFPDLPRTEPVLREPTPGTWRFRYWIKILEFAERTGVAAPARQALGAFDAALNHPDVAFDVPLRAGDLIVLDNHRVAHGRRAFPREIPGEDGSLRPTTRAIYNVHVFCDL